MKIKLQAIEPDTCDGANEGRGCRYIELWDVEAPAAQRTHEIVAFDRMCAAHFDPSVDLTVMKWADGNWKPKDAYIAYQREWFLRLNHVEWLAKRPNELMPPQIAGKTVDPVTTGSRPAPPQSHIDGMARAGALNRQHNNWKALARLAAKAERSTVDDTTFSWSWTGTGDNRALRVNTGGQLTAQQRGRALAALDIQFGAGRIVIEG